MRGMGRLFKRGTIYWIAYCYRGREHRESSQSPRERDAKRKLRQRLEEIGRGKLIGPQEERVTFEDLAQALIEDYQVRGLRSLNTLTGRLTHLRECFGLARALDITTDRIRAYQVQRLRNGASPATVNREIAALTRMFSLAVTAGRLGLKPPFPERPEEATPRQGFFEHTEYQAIRQRLPVEAQGVLDFGYYSGWRRQEILGLRWAEVDLAAGVIRLSPERSKTKTSRVLPLSPPLRTVLEARSSARLISSGETPRVTDLVFHRDGAPIRGFRRSWATACERAGLRGKLFHDLRRTAIRNMVRAGVPERVAMEISGHRTRSVFDRYNIVSEADLRQATERLAEYVADQPTVPVVIPFAR